MENIGTDFTALIDENYINDIAEEHIKLSENRYRSFVSKMEIRKDLYLNYDISVEVSEVTELLKRDITFDEYEYLLDNLIGTIIKLT